MQTKALLSVVPVAAMLLLACDKPSSGDGPASSASAPVTSASAPAPSASASASAVASAMPLPSGSAKPGGDRRGGMTGMLIRAARDLPDLKDPQKATVDKIEDGLKKDDPMAAMAEFKGVHDDMVAGVKAGKIDTAKMTAHYAAIDKAAQARQDKEAEALNGLYAALDAGQRKALTAAVRAKAAAHDADDKGHPDAGAPADWTKRRLERMTKDLALDDAQQKSVGALLAKQPSPAAMDAMRADGKKRLDAVLAAFEKDGFDAKKLDLSMAPAGKKPHDMIDQQVQFTTALLGILKPDQRDKLAATMDKPRGMGGGGPGGRPDMHGPGPGGMGNPFSQGSHDDE